MHDLFISYAFANQQIADDVCRYLEAKNLRCWYATRDARPSKDYRAEIMAAIAEAKCFVLIYTKESNQSKDVQNEVTAAIKADIPILPFRVEDVPMDPVLAYHLNGVHWLDGVGRRMEENLRILYETVCKIRGIEPLNDGSSKAPFAEVVPGPAPAPRKWRLIPLLAGVMAALVLFFGAIDGCVPTPPDETGGAEGPIAAGSIIAAPEGEVLENILMENEIRTDDQGVTSYELEKDDLIFNTGITRRQVKTITFLDTLHDAPADAADASALGNGRVKAWTVSAETTEDGELYHLYIAAEGGVCAPANSSWLLALLPNATAIDFGDCFFTVDVTNMDQMFRWCEKLEELDLSGFDTSKVTNMDSMFCNCRALTRLEISGFRTHNVTNMGQMFYRCEKLGALDVSGFNTENVSNMTSMFCGCRELTELDVSGFRTQNVDNMNQMFFGCEKLTELDVSKFDTARVTSMSAMFLGCKLLTELEVSDFQTGNVQDMNQMFRGCESLKKLDVSDFDTSKVKDMSYMFWDCPFAEELDVSGFDTSMVEKYEYFMNDDVLIGGEPWTALFS